MKSKSVLFIAMAVIFLFFFTFLFALNILHINNPTIDAETDSHVSASIANEVYDISDETDDERTYDSFLHLPFLDMPLADDEVFEIYKAAYSKIEFYGEFEKGDVTVYDYYKERYKQLLNNERDLFDPEKDLAIPEAGRKYFLNEFRRIKSDVENDIFDLNNYTYYFFDMDEDNMPELGMSDNSFEYIFKYIPDSDEFVLWYDLTPNYQLIGSKKLMGFNLGTGLGHAFYQLDENGETEYSIFCYSTSMFNKKTRDEEGVYIVSFPRQRHSNKQFEMNEKLKKEAYKDSYDILYHRVTKEQYDELTKDYWESEKLARKKLKEIASTYEELFGNH